MKPPITIDVNATLLEVIRTILHEKISRLLVTKEDNIVAIVTEKDVGLFLLQDTSERKLQEIKLSEVSKPIQTVNEFTAVNDCAKTMLENGIGSVGVTSNEKVIGIITKSDLTKYFAEECVHKKTVGEYMSPFYAWAYSDESLYSIVSTMIMDRVSRLVLRNHEESPIGIITFRDIFDIAMTEGQEENVLDNTDPNISIVFPRKGFLSQTGFGNTIKASEVMKNEIITVNYDDDLANASKILVENKINGVGVLSSYGTLIGILSKTDIMRAVAFLN